MKARKLNREVTSFNIEKTIRRRLIAYAKGCRVNRSDALNALLDEVLPKETK